MRERALASIDLDRVLPRKAAPKRTSVAIVGQSKVCALVSCGRTFHPRSGESAANWINRAFCRRRCSVADARVNWNARSSVSLTGPEK